MNHEDKPQDLDPALVRPPVGFDWKAVDLSPTEAMAQGKPRASPRSRRIRAYCLLAGGAICLLVVVHQWYQAAGLGELYDAHMERVARDQVKELTQAVLTYKVIHGDYPLDLSTLAQKQLDGGKPLIEVAALKDPWGRSFEYEPDGPMNGGRQPDIWSTGHPEKKNAIIGNWFLETRPSKN